MDFHEAHRIDPRYEPSIQNLKKICRQIGVDNLINTALQKKQENDKNLCQIYLECIMIADKENNRAKKELEKLQDN